MNGWMVMNFYSHQESYSTIDRTEMKKMIKRISDNNYPGSITHCDFEFIAKKRYNIYSGITWYNQYVIEVYYKTLTTQDIESIKFEMGVHNGLRSSSIRLDFYKEYPIKLGFFKNRGRSTV
jgi:hypothetical protein